MQKSSLYTLILIIFFGIVAFLFMGSSVNAALPSSYKPVFDYNAQWKYSKVPPNPDWKGLFFYDASWSTGNGPFGRVSYCPGIWANTGGWGGGEDIYLRKIFTLDYATTKIKIYFGVDDKLTCYLDGFKIIDYRSPGCGAVDQSSTERSVSSGTHILACIADDYGGSQAWFGLRMDAWVPVIDADNDGIADSYYGVKCTGGAMGGCDDNCLNNPNPNQADSNNNGIGDVCDDPDTNSAKCSSVGGVWLNNQCCGDDGANDDYPGCVDGKIDADNDGVMDTADKCPNTPPTEANEVYKNPSSPFNGCSSSQGAFCLIKGAGAICQSGPLCATNPAYNNQQNNMVCNSLTCDASGSCSVQTGCTPCPVQSCNQFDSYFVGCYTGPSGLPTEYRDYIDTYQVCQNGACQAQTCSYNVLGPTTQKDSDKDGIIDFCDTDPCGQNTFLGSKALDSVGCFCEGNFTDCDQSFSNGCEKDVNLEGLCPGIPRCTIPATTIQLASGQTCMGPASENALGGMICTAGQYFCYGLCRNVSCDTPTELCEDPNDYDCDGMPNDYEFKYGLAVFDPIDKNLDPDLEGLVNIREFEYLTNPFNPDTDGDGLSDLNEINVSDPLNPDSDADGLIDGDEVFYLTKPMEQDTDGDGLFDGDEIQAIIDWTGRADKNAIKSFVQKDGCLISDGCIGDELGGLDGLNNGPFDPDTDGDGLSDFEEVKGINGLISNPFDPKNTCSFECSVWSPDPCEEDQAQTRTCSQGTNCAGVGYKPKESQQCRSGFTGLEEKVPFFTPINIVITLVIILGYYLITLRKKA